MPLGAASRPEAAGTPDKSGNFPEGDKTPGSASPFTLPADRRIFHSCYIHLPLMYKMHSFDSRAHPGATYNIAWSQAGIRAAIRTNSWNLTNAQN
jgi:hypothetical protein